jgi:hypothetical protein
LDRAAARVLRVQPQPAVPAEPVPATAGWSFETPLLLAGVLCVLRYVVLPLVLALLGVATGATIGVVTGAALGLLLTLNVIAVVAIVATLLLLVGFFFVIDARVLVV